MRSLTKTSASGFAWLLGQSGSTRAISFLSQMVLARLLRPADFGDIALATSVVTVISSIVGFGLDDVLLSRSSKMPKWAAPAFWISFAFALIGGLSLLVAAPIAAHFYHSHTVRGLLSILSLSMPLGALVTVPNAFLRSQLKFRFIAIYGTLELAASQLAIILLAFSGFGAYSFVIASPILALVRAIVFWRVARPPVKQWLVRRRQMVVLLRSGSMVGGQRLVTTLRENGDYILLGALANKSVVGLYFMAFKLAAIPAYTLVNGMASVLFPALAQLRGDANRQLQAALSASRTIALIVIPLSFLQAAVAGPLIHLFLGKQWVAAGPMLSLLSVGLSFDIVPCVAGSLMNANGRFKSQWLWSISTIPLFFLLIGLGWLMQGAAGVAAGVALFFIIGAPCYSYFALRTSGASIRDVLGIYLPPVLCAVTGIGAGYLLSKTTPLEGRDLLAMATTSAFGLGAYAVFIRYLSPTATKATMNTLSTILGRTI